LLGKILRVLKTLPFVPRAALDVLRTPGSTASAFPGASPTRRVHDRLRATSLLLRLAELAKLSLGCRRRAFAYCRALRRGGAPVRLIFGIREVRSGEKSKAGYIGHVWASAAPDGADVALPSEYVAVAEMPRRRTQSGWRRG